MDVPNGHSVRHFGGERHRGKRSWKRYNAFFRAVADSHYELDASLFARWGSRKMLDDRAYDQEIRAKAREPSPSLPSEQNTSNSYDPQEDVDFFSGIFGSSGANHLRNDLARR